MLLTPWEAWSKIFGNVWRNSAHQHWRGAVAEIRDIFEVNFGRAWPPATTGSRPNMYSHIDWHGEGPNRYCHQECKQPLRTQATTIKSGIMIFFQNPPNQLWNSWYNGRCMHRFRAQLRNNYATFVPIHKVIWTCSCWRSCWIIEIIFNLYFDLTTTTPTTTRPDYFVNWHKNGVVVA